MGDVIFGGMTPDGALAGIPLVLSLGMFDGELFMAAEGWGIMRGPVLVLGTLPVRVGSSEWCRREALERVHRGLADVLAWLGEEPYVKPRPHAELLQALDVVR